MSTTEKGEHHRSSKHRYKDTEKEKDKRRSRDKERDRDSNRESDRKHKKRRKCDNDYEGGWKHKHREKDEENHLAIVDNDKNDDDMWVEKNIDMEGKQVCICSYNPIICIP